jgi:hypothetical protein
MMNGANIMSGVGYTKDLKTGEVNWNGLSNCQLQNYWRATSYAEMIKSFNTNTNDVSAPTLIN